MSFPSRPTQVSPVDDNDSPLCLADTVRKVCFQVGEHSGFDILALVVLLLKDGSAAGRGRIFRRSRDGGPSNQKSSTTAV